MPLGAGVGDALLAALSDAGADVRTAAREAFAAYDAHMSDSDQFSSQPYLFTMC